MACSYSTGYREQSAVFPSGVNDQVLQLPTCDGEYLVPSHFYCVFRGLERVGVWGCVVLGSDLGKGCWHLEEARWEGSCLKHRDSIDPRYQVAGSARGHRLPPQSGRGTEKLGDPR